MRLKRIFFILLILAIAGCSKNMIINVDGMPISDHEYNLSSQETGIRVVFVLARYYKEYEGEEYIVKPQYLDAMDVNKVDPARTDKLILHIKVINLQKKFYSLKWQIDSPARDQSQGLLYTGKLSRKDYYLNLPTAVPGDYAYSFTFSDKDGNDLFDLPRMGYRVKGGVNPRLSH